MPQTYAELFQADFKRTGREKCHGKTLTFFVYDAERELTQQQQQQL
jgi:hypothetical protein